MKGTIRAMFGVLMLVPWLCWFIVSTRWNFGFDADRFVFSADFPNFGPPFYIVLTLGAAIVLFVEGVIRRGARWVTFRPHQRQGSLHVDVNDGADFDR